MSPIAKKEYTENVAPRYKKASKRIKTIILNHYCEVTEYHRNHAIRKLNHCLDKKHKRKPGRPSVYNQDYMLHPLRKIWKASEYPCSIRLKVIIQDTLEKHGVIKAALFGSIVRNDARDDSDIDLLVEFGPGKSLLDLARLKLELESLLGRKVDIVTYRSLHPLLKDRILKNQVIIR